MKLWKRIPADIRLLLVGAALAGVLGSYGVVFHAGIEHQKAKVSQANEKAVKAHAKIERKIMALPDPDLDQRLAEWMRD